MNLNGRISTFGLILIMAGILAGISFSGLSGQAAALATSTRRATPTRTRLVTSLIRQLSWGGLGAGPSPECEEDMLDQLNGLPDIINVGRVEDDMAYVGAFKSHAYLCVFGLDFSSGFTVNLYRPDGSQIDPVSYSSAASPDNDGYWALDPIEGPSETIPQTGYTLGSDIPVIELQMWWPAGIPKGEWYIDITTPDGNGLSAPFIVDSPGRTPVVQYNRPPVWHFPKAHLLEVSKERYIRLSLYSALNGIKKVGDTIQLYGANFAPGSITPLGIYAEDPLIETGGVVLLRQINGTANQRGDWIASYTIQAGDPAGFTFFTAVMDPTGSKIEFAGPGVVYTVGEWQVCANTYASRLRAGWTAKVIEDQAANRIRVQPNRNAAIRGSIPAGEWFTILEGPACADNWVWWRVRTQTGIEGWTAEGDQNERWLTHAGE